MEEQIKMERNKTTTYITAKKSTGCSAPMDEEDLDFIQYRFLGFFKKIGFCVFPAIGVKIHLSLIKIEVKLMGCKRRSTQ
jgi:hypothetical protein